MARWLLAVLVAAAAAGGSATASVPPPAVTYDMDVQHDRATAASEPAPPLALRWSRHVIDGSARPEAIAGGRVFVSATATGGTGSAVVALNESTGDELWRHALKYQPGLAYDSGRVYALMRDGTLTAYAADSGAQLWSTSLGQFYDFTATPVAAGGVVYVAGAYALDGASGRILWSQHAVGATPALDATNVYLAAGGQRTWGIARSDGSLRWSHDTGSGGALDIPVVYGGRLYAHDDSGPGGHVYDPASGAVLGPFDWPAGTAFAQGMAVYPPNYGSTIVAVDLSTGATRWTYQGTDFISDARPIVVGDVAYATDQNTLLALDLHTGARLWSTDPSGADSVGGLIAGEGTLAFTNGTGDILAFGGAPHGGAPHGGAPVGGAPFTGVAVLTRRARVRRAVAHIRVACARSAIRGCRGKLVLEARARSYGATEFSAASGQSKTLSVRLSRRALRRLRARRSIVVTAAVAAQDGAGAKAARRSRLTLHA